MDPRAYATLFPRERFETFVSAPIPLRPPPADVRDAAQFHTIIKTAGEPGEGCSSRLLFAFSREGAMYRA